jgi:arylsulfatase A-like enzyme
MNSKMNGSQLIPVFLGTMAISSSLFSCNSDNPGDKSSQKSNIIFIMADDMGYHDLGCYGQTKIQTPNIDALAAQGTRFTQCYAGSTVSAPSRSVLMTGQHTGNTQVRGNMCEVGGVPVWDNGSLQLRPFLRPVDTTVADVLKKAGYVTGLTGKWGLGEPKTSGTPNRQGFDEWLGYLNQRRAHTYYPPYLWRNEKKIILEGNQGGNKNQYIHDMFTDFALDFIKQHQDTTFFLYLPYTIPHSKYEIPSIEPYADKDWSHDAKVHAAMITRLDEDVGEIMDRLKQYDIDKNTMVFFCSDNGAARLWEGTFNSSGKLRGHKRDLTEGGIRTPMIVRMPGKVPQGKVSEKTWYFADVLPTLADLADAEPPVNIDGISVLPTLFGEKQNLKDRFFYWEFDAGDFNQAVRWRDWKAIRSGEDQSLQLYDLSEDVGETNDIAGDHPEIVKKIREYLHNARTESKYWRVDNK